MQTVENLTPVAWIMQITEVCWVNKPRKWLQLSWAFPHGHKLVTFCILRRGEGKGTPEKTLLVSPVPFYWTTKFPKFSQQTFIYVSEPHSCKGGWQCVYLDFLASLVGSSQEGSGNNLGSLVNSVSPLSTAFLPGSHFLLGDLHLTW